LRFPHCVDARDGKHVIVQTQCIFAIQLLYVKLGAVIVLLAVADA